MHFRNTSSQYNISTQLINTPSLHIIPIHHLITTFSTHFLHTLSQFTFSTTPHMSMVLEAMFILQTNDEDFIHGPKTEDDDENNNTNTASEWGNGPGRRSPPSTDLLPQGGGSFGGGFRPSVSFGHLPSAGSSNMNLSSYGNNNNPPYGGNTPAQAIQQAVGRQPANLPPLAAATKVYTTPFLTSPNSALILTPLCPCLPPPAHRLEGCVVEAHSSFAGRPARPHRSADALQTRASLAQEDARHTPLRRPPPVAQGTNAQRTKTNTLSYMSANTPCHTHPPPLSSHPCHTPPPPLSSPPCQPPPLSSPPLSLSLFNPP